MSEKKRRERHPHVKYIEKDKNGKYVYKAHGIFLMAVKRKEKRKMESFGRCAVPFCVL